jgi:hypothetical protein
MKVILCLVISLSILLFSEGAFAATKPPTDCSKTFVGCVTSKFSSKFPFDVLANIPKNQAQCPKITFTVGNGKFVVSRDFDICWIYDLVKIVKYPLTAALIVKIYLFS